MNSYSGKPTTLCTGCGHNSISKWIESFCKTKQVVLSKLIKIGGIGCSSKSIGYFLDGCHGVYSIHGRAAAIAAGVSACRPDLKTLLISGDGDSLNIGLNHFIHMIRRNDPVIYILENNGVYGLTKGQPSASNDIDSPTTNKFSPQTTESPIDPSALALFYSASFVGRAFSGDKKQFTSLLELAWQCPGFCLIEVLSPCVAYGNLPQATKSFSYIKKHKNTLNEINCIYETKPLEGISTSQTWSFSLGDQTYTITPHDNNFDVKKPQKALQTLLKANSEKKLLTGLFHINPKSAKQGLNLSALSEKELKPSEKELEKIQEPFKI